MRLKQYITENNDIDLNGVYTDLFNDIMKQCKPFMKEWLPIYKKQHDFLYRGMEAKDFGIKNVRKNRKPMSTSRYAHTMLNKVFKDKFGWYARSNSIFCTGSDDDAGTYGDLYVIFPIGKYKYLWSPKIEDLTISIYQFGDIVQTGTNYTDMFNKELIKDNENTVEKLIKTYKTTNLDKALESNNEIMINAHRYYIRKESNVFDEFNTFLKQNT